jgi:hypothetical protein
MSIGDRLDVTVHETARRRGLTTKVTSCLDPSLSDGLDRDVATLSLFSMNSQRARCRTAARTLGKRAGFRVWRAERECM